VVAVSVIHRQGLEMSFVKFVRMALPFALVHVVLATFYVLLVLR
jgi:Na+/H+ antiporter NhaD/arsenite permease-like protein